MPGVKQSEYQEDVVWQAIYEALVENATSHWPDDKRTDDSVLDLLDELVVPDADRVFEALKESDFL